MTLDIEIQDVTHLRTCSKCGVVFNEFKCSDDAHLSYYKRIGKCPLCNEEFEVWEND